MWVCARAILKECGPPENVRPYLNQTDYWLLIAYSLRHWSNKKRTSGNPF